MTRDSFSFPITPIILLIVAIICVFTVASASGQNVGNDQVWAEIEKTDWIIEQAADKLAGTTNIKAEELLRQAVMLQGKAKEYHRNHRPRFAHQHTLTAREYAIRAVGLLIRANEDYALVEKEIDRTDFFLEKAQQIAAGVEVGRHLLLRLEEAAKLQDRARDLFSEQRLKQALNLTLKARDILIDLSKQYGHAERNKERFLKQRDRVEGLYEQARAIVSESNNQAAERLLENGAKHLQNSDKLLERGRFEEASRQLTQAATKFNRAMRLAAGETAGNVVRALETAAMQLERLKERADDLDFDQADDLLEEATEKLAKARRFYKDGQYDQALVLIRVVMELNQQAARIIGEW